VVFRSSNSTDIFLGWGFIVEMRKDTVFGEMKSRNPFGSLRYPSYNSRRHPIAYWSLHFPCSPRFHFIRPSATISPFVRTGLPLIDVHKSRKFEKWFEDLFG
jgi:hypothetical protein